MRQNQDVYKDIFHHFVQPDHVTDIFRITCTIALPRAERIFLLVWTLYGSRRDCRKTKTHDCCRDCFRCEHSIIFTTTLLEYQYVLYISHNNSSLKLYIYYIPTPL